MGFFDGPEYPTPSFEEQQRARLDETLDLLGENPALLDSLRIKRTEMGGYALALLSEEGSNA